MSDPFGGTRSGGFGSPTLNPFGGMGGDLGRYNIGDLGSQSAAWDKYAAETAWNNGTITDDAYIAALRTYLGTTAPDSRERTSAQNELDDAIYTIGRNELVRNIENGNTSRQRVAGWTRLIAYDRRHLRGMVGDNEQRRELEDRIAEAEGAVRAETWNDLVRRYNRNRMSIGQMLAAARRMAGRSRGDRDHEDWLDQVVEWQQRSDQEQQNDLMQDWNMERIDGSAVLRFMDQRLAGMSPNSPQYAELERQREDMAKAVRNRANNKKDAQIEDDYQRFKLSDQAYLDYWQKRLADAPKGSEEQRSLRSKVQGATFTIAERRATDRFERTGNPDELIDLYSGALATSSPGSSLARDLELRIARLRSEAWGTLGDPGVSFGGTAGAGRYPPLGHLLAPGGTPVNAEGFASQFDGSPFASSNCVYASTAMLAWAAGVTGLSGGDMRFYSGDTDDDGTAGGTMEDAARALGQVGLGARQEHGIGISQFRRRLSQGEGAVVFGLYANVSGQFRLSDFNGFHGVYVDRAKRGKDGRTYYYVMDPLGRQGYNGAWWPEELMERFAWSNAQWGSGSNYGDVLFATRNGNRVVSHRNRPPIQSFDTDANGRSTHGRGGGRNREEAGYRPPNFGQNRRKPKPSGAAQSVEEFLGAVTRVGGQQDDPLATASGDDRAAMRKRASDLLAKYEGDVRMAAIEWFTGEEAPLESATWTTGQLFYANAVGGQYGMEAIGPAGTGTTTPGAPAAPAVGTEPSTGFEPGDGTRSGTVQEATSQPSPFDRVARALLQKLGAPDSPDMIRAVVAVMTANSGGRPGDLPATNPFLITTAQQGDPSMVFGSLDEGLNATVDELLDRYPQIAMAARSGDPRRFLDTWGKSDWNPNTINSTTLIRGFNELPGDTKLYGGERYLDTPDSLKEAARKTPDLENLVNIDPTDPMQRAWWQQNWSNIREAAEAGYANWTFVTPDGRTVTMPFSPGLEIEMGRIGYEHATLDVEIARMSGDPGLIEDAERRQRGAISEMGEVTVELGRDVWREMGAQADGALSRGEVGTALAIYQARRDFVASEILRSFAPVQGPTGDIPVMGGMNLRPSADVARTTNPFLDADDRNAIGNLLDGDEIRDLTPLLQPDAQGRTGFTEDGSLNPARDFLVQEPNNRGEWRMRVVDIHTNPDLFAETTLDVDPVTGAENKVPLYLTPQSGRVPMRLGNGAVVYQEVREDQGAGADVYLFQPVSVAKTVQQQAQVVAPPIGGGIGGVGFVPPVDPTQQLPPTTPPLQPTFQPRTLRGLVMTATYDPISRSVVEWFSLPGTNQWFGAPQGKRPTLVIRDEAARLITYDKATGEPMYNNKTLASQPDSWAQLLGFYGSPGTRRINNQPGIGARDQTFVVRDADPMTGTIDSSLTDMDRFRLGGNFWERGRSIPSSFVLESADMTASLISRAQRMEMDSFVEQTREQSRRGLGLGEVPAQPTTGITPFGQGVPGIDPNRVRGPNQTAYEENLRAMGLPVPGTVAENMAVGAAHGVARQPMVNRSIFENIAAGVRAQSEAARTQAAAATVLAEAEAARQAAIAQRLRAEQQARAAAAAQARRAIPIFGSPSSPRVVRPEPSPSPGPDPGAGRGGTRSRRGGGPPRNPEPAPPPPVVPVDTGGGRRGGRYQD